MFFDFLPFGRVMNLIGHYACAANFSAPLQLGAVIPDLVPLLQRKPRIHQIAALWKKSEPEGTSISGVLDGIEFHLFVDRAFHKAPLFLSCAEALTKTLNEASDEKGLKRFFAAHVGAELYFDHLLLTRYPELGEGFNHLLKQTRDNLLNPFVLAHPAFEKETWDDFMDKIITPEFLGAYFHVESLIERLQQVLTRMRQRPLNIPEKENLILYFEKHRNWFLEQLLDFCSSMQRWDDSIFIKSPAVEKTQETLDLAFKT